MFRIVSLLIEFLPVSIRALRIVFHLIEPRAKDSFGSRFQPRTMCFRLGAQPAGIHPGVREFDGIPTSHSSMR